MGLERTYHIGPAPVKLRRRVELLEATVQALDERERLANEQTFTVLAQGEAYQQQALATARAVLANDIQKLGDRLEALEALEAKRRNRWWRRLGRRLTGGR